MKRLNFEKINNRTSVDLYVLNECQNRLDQFLWL